MEALVERIKKRHFTKMAKMAVNIAQCTLSQNCVTSVSEAKVINKVKFRYGMFGNDTE